MENIDQKLFLKKLNDNQLKELILLCGKHEKIDKFERIQSLNDINLQLPTKKEEWDLGEYLHINVYIGPELPLFQTYDLNDFEMIECSGWSKQRYNELLKEYLTIQFGEEYIEHLFNKHVSDAMKEKQALTDYYHKNKSELGEGIAYQKRISNK